MEKDPGSNKSGSRVKKILFVILRIIISAGLFAVLIVLNIKNLNSIPSIFKSINIGFALAGIFFYLLGILLEAPRWHTLLSANKVNVPILYLLNSTLIGFFFSTLLPTSVGGDTYRAYDLRKTFKVSHHKNIIAIYLGRFFGILTGGFWVISSFLSGMYSHLNKPLLIGTIIMFPLVTLLIFITFFPKKFKIDVFFGRVKFLKKFESKTAEFIEILHDFKSKKKEIFISIFLSLCANLSTFISFYFIGLSLKISLSFLSYIFIVPVMWSASNLPITLGGFGVRENTLVLLLKSFNVNAANALTFSLIVMIINILIAILGGVIYILRNISIRKAKK
ncbi:MAG: lysylphosphatidylglycerol synthase transmembrane domain-containing protein [Candidatus Humimicrobiaceae bacterium]